MGYLTSVQKSILSNTIDGVKLKIGAAFLCTEFDLLFSKIVILIMQLPIQFNLNSILIILIGTACIVGGVAMSIRPGGAKFGAGLFLTGVGNLLLGMTNGFSNPTPTGRILFRIGATAYIIGVPILVYGIYTTM